jgi:hypothetical protein
MQLERLPFPQRNYCERFSANICHVIQAPAGRLTYYVGFSCTDSGAPDDVAPAAVQSPLAAFCRSSTLVYLPGKPLLRDRPTVGFALVRIRQGTAGLCRWFRPSASATSSTTQHHFRPMNTPIPPRTAYRVPQGRASASQPPTSRHIAHPHAVPLHERAGAANWQPAISATSGNPRRSSTQDFKRPWLRSLSTAIRWYNV